MVQPNKSSDIAASNLFFSLYDDFFVRYLTLIPFFMFFLMLGVPPSRFFCFLKLFFFVFFFFSSWF